MTQVAVTCIQLIRRITGFSKHRLEPFHSGAALEGEDLVEACCIGVVAGDDQFTATVMDRCPEE